MRAVVLITILNILRYGSSYPLQGQTDSEKCLATTPERQDQINSIIDQIGDLLRSLSKQYEDIEISDVKMTVNRYTPDASKPKQTDLTILINECKTGGTEDISEASKEEDASISETSDEFNFDSTDLSYFNDSYEETTASPDGNSEEITTKTNIDGTQPPNDAKGNGEVNNDLNVNQRTSNDQNSGITIAFLVDDIKGFNANDIFVDYDRFGKRNTIALMSEEKKPDEIKWKGNTVASRPATGLEIDVVNFSDQEDQVLNELERIRGRGPFLMFERPHVQRFIF